MSSRKFDITEAFIQALQEQENRDSLQLSNQIKNRILTENSDVCTMYRVEDKNGNMVDDYNDLGQAKKVAKTKTGSSIREIYVSIDENTDDEEGDIIWYNKKQEARSHKEDNEKAAPRTIVNKNGKEVKTRNMVDVSNPKVGSNSYHNQKGNQYFGTTEAEYASKRNKTGQKNEYGYDKYLVDYDTMKTPVDKFQYEKNQAQLLNKDAQEYRQREKRARSSLNKEILKGNAENLETQVDKHNRNATEIINQEKERIAKYNKQDIGPNDMEENFGMDMVTDIVKDNIELGSTVVGALGGVLGLGESKKRRTLGKKRKR